MSAHCNHETHALETASCDALFAMKAASMFYGEKSKQFKNASAAYSHALKAENAAMGLADVTIDEVFAELDALGVK